MKKNTFLPSLVALGIMLSLMSTTTLANEYNVSTQGSTLYDKVFYQIGGGSAVIPAAARKKAHEYGFGIGWNGDFMCGNFDMKTTIKNQLNGITEGFKDLMSNIIESATGAVASLPAMIIQRANPQLYDLLTNGILQGRINFDDLKTSCEELTNKAGDYLSNSSWNWMAKNQSFGRIAQDEPDAVRAKKKAEQDAGKNGITWIGGEKKGGVGQESISLFGDVIKAGFNMANGQRATNKSAIPDCDGMLCTVWKSPKDVADWGTQVLGEMTKVTCTDCGTPITKPGTGLAPIIEEENIAVLTALESVLNKKNPTAEDLRSISSTQMPVTRGLLEALKEDPDVQLLATRLASEIAISRTLEKALLLRRTMLTGMREPNVANNKEALSELDKQLTALDREIEQVEMEMRLQRQITGNTALVTLEKRAGDRQKSLENNSIEDNDQRMKKLTGRKEDALSDNSNDGNFTVEESNITLPIPDKSGLSGLNGSWNTPNTPNTPRGGNNNGGSGLGGGTAGNYSPIPAIKGSAQDQTTGLLRKFEGFSSKAYWDVNAYRTGYGSDTITKADGTVVKVTKDTVVTKEDAERDLARRSQNFANTAKNQVSSSTWNALSPNVQAALTSYAYNYGSLTKDIVRAVKDSAQSGDMKILADAVRKRQTDNKGVNAKRRNQEADYILGK